MLPGGPPANATEARSREEALAFEVMEQSLEREWLDVMEHQVVAVEETHASREVKI